MNPQKAWALTTAHGVRLDGAGGGGGSVLPPAEVARLLNGLPRGPFLAGMVRFSGDVGSIEPLRHVFWLHAQYMAFPMDREGRMILELCWPQDHGQEDYCASLATLAVNEFAEPRPLNCRNCKNRGWVRKYGNGVACRVCGTPEVKDGQLSVSVFEGGHGGLPLTPSKRAAIAGIPLRSWKDGWGARYEVLKNALEGWSSRAHSHLKNRLDVMLEAA